MKVLSLTRERSDASAVASALHPSYPGVTVTWAARFDDATRWIGDNGDLNLLVLDAGLGSQACSSFVDSLRRRGLAPPAIVLAPSDADAGQTLAALGLGPGDCVLTHATLRVELPSAVRRADQRHRSAGARSEATGAPLLSELQIALAQSEQARAPEAKAAAEQLAKQARSFSASLGDLLQKRAALARRVSDLEAHLATEQARLTGELDREIAARQEVEQRLVATEAELARAQDELQQRLDEAKAAAENAHRDRTEARADVARLEAQILAVEATLHDARVRHTDELAAAVESGSQRLAERERELQAVLAETVLQRQELEDHLQAAHAESHALAARVSTAESALSDARAQRAADLAAAADRQSDLQQRLDALRTEGVAERQALKQRLLAEAAADRQSFEQRLDEATSAVAASQHDHAAVVAELDRHAHRQTELDAQLAARTVALEEQQAHADREQQEAAERLRALSLERNDIQRERDDARAEVQVLRDRVSALAQQLDDAERTRQEAADKRAAAAEQASVRESALQDELARERELRGVNEARWAEREATLVAESAEAEAALRTFEAQRLEVERALADAESREAAQQHSAAERHAALESQLHTERVRREAAEHERDAASAALRESQQATERMRGEHAHAITQFERQMAEADSQYTELAARQATAERAREDALNQQRDSLTAAATLHQAEVEHVRGDRARVTRELEAVTLALADVRAGVEQRFDEYPLALCRCTPAGVPVRANRAFASLLGCTSGNPDRALEAATHLFSSSGDVAWIVQRVGTPEAGEPVETVWKNAQGGRVGVRLSAARVPDGIDILAQDVTEQILMRERLERARRMEAVGRLASEVAATCQTTLEEVRRSAQGWLGSIQGHSPQKLRAELILDDVMRVLEQLRRFHAYGEAQADDVEPVDIHRTLRGLEPLMKEVAGDDIEIVMPKRGWLTTNRFYVDVREERVERILVNVAAYARQRMSHGGVMSFELHEAQLDRAFVEQYPSARQGPHALLTVREAKARPRTLIASGRLEEHTHTPDELGGNEQAGVDLAALQELVRASGGHLWVEASPGHLIIKIHLPSAPPDERRWSPVSAVFRREA